MTNTESANVPPVSHLIPDGIDPTKAETTASLEHHREILTRALRGDLNAQNETRHHLGLYLAAVEEVLAWRRTMADAVESTGEIQEGDAIGEERTGVEMQPVAETPAEDPAPEPIVEGGGGEAGGPAGITPSNVSSGGLNPST